MPNHYLKPGRIHGFCTSIDATLRGIEPPPRMRSDPSPKPEREPVTHEDIIDGEPPTKGPLIHLPPRARKVFHQYGIKTIKQLRALIASGKLNHRTYRNYGRTTHNAVLKALKIQPKCPHCGQTIKTK